MYVEHSKQRWDVDHTEGAFFATVGTLQIGYPHIQASSEDKEQNVRPRAATCLAAPNPASLPRWVLTLPRVLRLWTSARYRGGLRRCHVSHGPGPHQPTQEGFGAAMCPMAPGLASLPRRALTLSRVTWLQTPRPYGGGLCCCHVSRSSLWVVDLKYRERLSWPSYAARLACSQGALTCF
jgi:hypothetical protein